MAFVLNSKYKWFISILIPCITVAGIIFYPVVIHPFSSYIGVSGDAQQTMWFMGWFWHALIHGDNPFISHMINYPYGVNMMENASVIAEGAIFGILAMFMNSAFSYNVMMFVNLVFTGTLSTLILNKLGIRKWLSLVGGILIEIIPYTSAQLLGHANLTVTAWIFAMFYIAISALKGEIKRSTLSGIILGIFIGAQFYTSIEVFATLTMVIVCALVIGALVTRTELITALQRVSLQFYISTAVIVFLLILPGIYIFFFGQYALHGSIVQSKTSSTYVNDLLAIILPSPVYLLHNHVTTSIVSQFSGNYSEEDGYIGIVGIVLVIWAIQRTWKDKIARIVFILFVFVLLMSFGTHLHILGHVTRFPLPWIIFEKVPFIKQALPSRLMFFGDILVIILIFRAFENLISDNRQKQNALKVFVSFLLLSLTWFPSIPYAHTFIPVSFQSIEPDGKLYKELRNKPTLVLSDYFPSIMEVLADGKYTIPVSNVYAYQNDSLADITYRPNELSWMSSTSFVNLKLYLSAAVSSSNVKRILFINPDGKRISATLYSVLTSLYGNPICGGNNEIYIWKTKPSPSVWISGDVWDVQNIYNKKIWSGQDWSLHANNLSGYIIIEAPPSGYLTNDLDITIKIGSKFKNISVPDGQSISIPFDNETISFNSKNYFIPQNVLHNEDTRKLSMLIHVVLDK